MHSKCLTASMRRRAWGRGIPWKGQCLSFRCSFVLVYVQREADGLEGRLLIAGLLVAAVSFAAVHAAQYVLQG